MDTRKIAVIILKFELCNLTEMCPNDAERMANSVDLIKLLLQDYFTHLEPSQPFSREKIAVWEKLPGYLQTELG